MEAFIIYQEQAIQRGPRPVGVVIAGSEEEALQKIARKYDGTVRADKHSADARLFVQLGAEIYSVEKVRELIQ